jgi:peptidyl-prolyl cis-trans isomerase A (cyclophilin A)
MHFSRRAPLAALGACIIAAAACHVNTAPRPSPNWSELRVTTPDSFLVRFQTTRGTFDVMARSDWAPVGADRFYSLLRLHYYDDEAFFRVVKNFVAQFGISNDSTTNVGWDVRRIADDSVRHSNTKGTIAFARDGPDTRTVQLYINLRDNKRLDTYGGIGFAPIAEVVSGMNVVDSLYAGYGEARPDTGKARPGREGPPQDSIQRWGNAYLRRGWPRLDYIRTARVIREWRSPAKRLPE